MINIKLQCTPIKTKELMCSNSTRRNEYFMLIVVIYVLTINKYTILCFPIIIYICPFSRDNMSCVMLLHKLASFSWGHAIYTLRVRGNVNVLEILFNHMNHI